MAAGLSIGLRPDCDGIATWLAIGQALEPHFGDDECEFLAAACARERLLTHVASQTEVAGSGWPRVLAEYVELDQGARLKMLHTLNQQVRGGASFGLAPPHVLHPRCPQGSFLPSPLFWPRGMARDYLALALCALLTDCLAESHPRPHSIRLGCLLGARARLSPQASGRRRRPAARVAAAKRWQRGPICRGTDRGGTDGCR